MNIIFHIGTHKTGSTALQSFLKANRNKLLKRGYLYPNSSLFDAGHHIIAWKTLKEDKSKLDELFKAIESEAATHGVGIIILSSEEFEFIKNNQCLNLLFSRIKNAKTVIYLRRQDFYFESEYKQQVKMYGIRYKHDIYKFYFHVDLTQRFNYLRLCNAWENFSDISLINYENCKNEKTAIFKEFISQLGLEWDNDFAIPDDNNSNIGLTNLSSIYLARLNAMEFSKNQHFNAINYLNSLSGKSHSRPLLPLADRKILFDRFQGANSSVAKKYNMHAFTEPKASDYDNNDTIDFYHDFDNSFFEKLLDNVKSSWKII